MLSIKKNIFFAFLALHIVPSIVAAQPRLSDLDFKSASVLPVYIENGVQYCILSREAAGRDVGTYDDFGGSRDPGENHPVVSAAREFFEEAILELSIGLSLKHTRDFIDTNANNTEYVIAHLENVTYITDFTAYKNHFFRSFYAARQKAPSFKFKEKDMLATIELDTLKNAITQSKFNSNVQIMVSVLDPITKRWTAQQITLRPYFVKKLRPFFMDKPYTQGMNPIIRFYDPIVQLSSPRPAQPLPQAQQIGKRPISRSSRQIRQRKQTRPRQARQRKQTRQQQARQRQQTKQQRARQRY